MHIILVFAFSVDVKHWILRNEKFYFILLFLHYTYITTEVVVVLS